MVIPDDKHYSIRVLTRHLDISRSSYYYEPCLESEENLMLMVLIDRKYTSLTFLVIEIHIKKMSY